MVKRNSQNQYRMRAIIRRGKPACWLCGNPIDYELKYPDPGSFVIDHVQSLARGGADHISNVRACHASCNSTKRARDIAPIVRKSGSIE